RGSRASPEREQVCALRVDGGRGGLLRFVEQIQAELIAQHLECGKLADELRVDGAAAIEQVQRITDVAELRERIAEAAGLLQLAPEANEHDQLHQRAGATALLFRKLQNHVVEAAGLAFREHAVLPAAVRELHEAGLP